MPGYAVPMRGGAPVNSGQAAYNTEDVDLHVFYGFSYDNKTGRLVVDKIDGDEPIRVPDPNNLRPDDYQQWTLTRSVMNFSWDTTLEGHLIVEVE